MKFIKRIMIIVIVLAVIYEFYLPTWKQKLENLTVTDVTSFIDTTIEKGNSISNELGEWLQAKFSSEEGK